MGQKDLTEKNLELYPDVFADILNSLLYHGKQVVRAEELQSAPTETLYSRQNGRLNNQFHDVSKYVVRDGNIEIQYTLENETNAKCKTVLRKAGYEGAVYREQFDGTESYPVERENYAPTNQKIVHPKALLLMLKALTGDSRYEMMISDMKELEAREGGVTMCELLDKYEKRGITQGKSESIRNLMETMKWTAEQAMSALKIPDSEKAVYLASL